MGTRSATVNKTALAKARERRRALDRDRDAKDQRIEEATAMALIAVEGLAEAEDARTAASVAVGEALRELLAEDVSPERAAALVEVDVSEVRRLSKVAADASAADKAGGHLGGLSGAAARPEPNADGDVGRRVS